MVGDRLDLPIEAASHRVNRGELKAFTGLHPSTVYRLIAVGKFPAPVRLGPARVAWRESDIERWQNSLQQGVSTSPAEVPA